MDRWDNSMAEHPKDAYFAVGAYRAYMGSVERGETHPTLDGLATIARALNTSTSSCTRL